MIPKATYTKVRNYVRKLTDEYKNETVGKTGLAAVPVELGRNILSFLRSERVSDAEAEACCEYMAKQGLLAKHPWGGYMVPPSKESPAIPPKEQAEVMVRDAVSNAFAVQRLLAAKTDSNTRSAPCSS